MKILVTGSNGIIGQQLVKELLATYPLAHVFEINRRRPTHTPDKRVQSIELDLLRIDKKTADTFFKSIKPDFFFHLAWDTGHQGYLHTLDNIQWKDVSLMLIDSFYSSGGRKFVGIGSSIEYNWGLQNPFHETSPLSGNNYLYGQSKLDVFNYLASLTEKSYLWCRVFFVFGPGQSPTRLVPLIIKSALIGGEPLKINLELERDYISTFEIAKQIIMMLQTDFSGSVNICSGRVIKLADIVNSVESYTKRRVTLSSKPYQDDFEVKRICGSIGLIIGYYPDYSYSCKNFDMDIQKVIEDIKKQIG